MSKLTCIFAVLFSLPAFASGKLSFKQKTENGDDPTKYSLGLAVYEKILPHTYMNSWTGGGADVNTGKDSWLKSTNSIEIHVSRFSVGAGGSLTYLPAAKVFHKEGFFSLGVTLW